MHIQNYVILSAKNLLTESPTPSPPSPKSWVRACACCSAQKFVGDRASRCAFTILFRSLTTFHVLYYSNFGKSIPVEKLF